MKRLEACTLETFQAMLAAYPKNGLNVFTPLIHAESKWAFNIAYAILKKDADAEEVRNDSFVKWIRALNKSQDYGKLTRPFFKRIIENTSFDLLEKRKKEAAKSKNQPVETELYDVDNDILHENQLKKIYEGLEQLGAPCREMLLLNMKTKLSQAQIIQKLGLNYADASPSGIFRNCRNNLRAIIFN
jgi:RNA polymerase sigma factor (sigma-70 family)